jgi:hypothetical protein
MDADLFRGPWAFLDFPGDLACEKYRQYEGTGVEVFVVANSTKPVALGWHGGEPV